MNTETWTWTDLDGGGSESRGSLRRCVIRPLGRVWQITVTVRGRPRTWTSGAGSLVAAQAEAAERFAALAGPR